MTKIKEKRRNMQEIRILRKKIGILAICIFLLQCSYGQGSVQIKKPSEYVNVSSFRSGCASKASWDLLMSKYNPNYLYTGENVILRRYEANFRSDYRNLCQNSSNSNQVGVPQNKVTQPNRSYSSSSSSSNSTYQNQSFGNQLANAAMDAVITTSVPLLFNLIINGSQERQMQQQLEAQRQAELAEWQAEQERIRHEKFIADAAKTRDRLIGYDEDDKGAVVSRNLFGIKTEAKLLGDEVEEVLNVEENYSLLIGNDDLFEELAQKLNALYKFSLDNAVVATIGKSEAPIYVNPSDLKVNMGIQDKQISSIELKPSFQDVVEKEKIIAGVNINAVSTEILLYFKNNGVDNYFANREIDRILTEKYGASLGLLPSDKQKEYIKDYNILSKSIEENVKRMQGEMKNKQNQTYLNEFENYNNSLIYKRIELLKEANEWELRDKIYSICSNPVNKDLDNEAINNALNNFKEQHIEMGFSIDETNKKLDEILVEMKNESFRRNAARNNQVFEDEFKDKTFKDAVDILNEIVSSVEDNTPDSPDDFKSGEAGFQLGIGIKNASRENELANKKYSLRNEAQTLLQNIESNNKLIEQITNNDIRSANFKISHNIVTNQNAYNNNQQQRLIDETLKQIEFNNQIQSLNIQNIPETPKTEIKVDKW